MSRSILLVSYFWPPSTEAGIHRPMAMTKHLRRMGHAVTVLTTSAYGRSPEDGRASVERGLDLQVPYARLRGRRHAEGIFEGGSYSRERHPLSYVLVPEPTVLAWAPFAVARALRLHRRRRFDAVITTSPPESAHLIGWALQRAGAAWVADIRDGWTFESFRPAWPTGLQARLDRALEAGLMRAADRVSAVAQPLVDDLRHRVGARAELVPNGWDPELVDGLAQASASPLDPERKSVVYTGRLAIVDRSPRALVDALQELAAEEPRAAERLELVFAGSYTDDERALFATDVAPARIQVLGNLPRHHALALQREADALLLVTSGTRRHEVTGKVFEYLGAGRPIVALAGDDEAARIVRETRSGPIVAPDDRAGAKDALRRLAQGALEPPPRDALRKYAYPGVAEAMARLLEEAISARGSRPRAP